MAGLERPTRPPSSHDVRSQDSNTSTSTARFIDARSRQDEVATKNFHSTAISSPFRQPLSFPSHEIEPTIDITEDLVHRHPYIGLPSHNLQRDPGIYHSSDYGDESSLLLKRSAVTSFLQQETASRTPVQQLRYQKHVPVPAVVLFARDAAPLYLPKLDKYLSSIPSPRFSQDVDQSVPFPPMGNLAKLGMSLEDLETNRKQIPVWRNRNDILGSAVNVILGLMVCIG